MRNFVSENIENENSYLLKIQLNEFLKGQKIIFFHVNKFTKFQKTQKTAISKETKGAPIEVKIT